LIKLSTLVDQETLASVVVNPAGIEAGAYCIVDCRFDLSQPDGGYQEYLTSHIPGAVYAHLDKDLAGPVTAGSGRHPLPDPQDFARTLERLGIGNDSGVIVYDHANGAYAARFWWLLRWLGHRRVAVLNGGYNGWVRAGRAVQTEVPQPASTQFVPNPQWSMRVSTDDVVRSLNDTSAPTMLDARDEVRFSGQSEPIDAVAGHIPGAVNFPFSRHVDADGVWKARETLERLWQSVAADAQSSVQSSARPTVMCGSGVTACHLILSACHAGQPEPRLYAGSWSEWIRDPDRPTEANSDA